ncbi:MAG: hypothetical protein QNJ53_30405, partial [Pleurocapsa sp. MO_192.B19]|nr:hypothetical protein [Pleurocapsa sp. MO_192.B19]
MVDKIAFQSIGGVEGIYLPSKENPKYGTLLTDYGIFPAETSKRVREKLFKKADSNSDKSLIEKRLKFLAWIKGSDESPYYSLDLRSIHDTWDDWIKEDNRFHLQGLISERTPERVLLRIQRNHWQGITPTEIEQSISHLQIKNCPKNVKKSQFWYFRVSIVDGMLHCTESQQLANAKDTKRILKSWATEPVEFSRYKEIL